MYTCSYNGPKLMLGISIKEGSVQKALSLAIGKARRSEANTRLFETSVKGSALTCVKATAVTLQ